MSQLFLGVSLKMYFGRERTIRWCRTVADIAANHPAVRDNHVQLAVLPSFPYVSEVADVFAGTPVFVGGQDLFWSDQGAFTGEVSGSQLRELGCEYVEIGHAERLRIFGETPAMIAAKTAAAFRNQLTPILCVGEAMRGTPAGAARHCRTQLDAALDEVDASSARPLVVAYEPHWAIGADEPASTEYVAMTCDAIRDHVDSRPGFAGSRVIYGGSAGPGLLTALDGSVDGLFLGRFAHDPAALERILTEAEALDGRAATLAAGSLSDTGRHRWQSD
jgi:triosephosphate isomerase